MGQSRPHTAECVYRTELRIVWKKKKNSSSGFPCLDCFAWDAERKTTSFGLNLVVVLQGLQNEKV